MSNAPEFDAALLRRYDHGGPRYTSYPTVPHFDSGFGDAQYRRQALATNDDPIPRPLSLYVHIPFCASPCFYCGCNRVITRDRTKADAYLTQLEREIALQAELFDGDRAVTQLHLGGGTPNFLDGGQLRRLLDALARRFNLVADDGREFSIEIDPRCVDDAAIRDLAAMGFNRASFGVQDFDPVVQAAVNRVQPLQQTVGAIAAARDAGFRSVSIDLIYGLPRQTRAGFEATLATMLTLRPDRIALYSYAHLPEIFKAQRRIVASELPEPAEKLALLGMAVATLTAAGYRYIGMDHFALPGDALVRAQDTHTLQRNFQGYSTHAECELLGLGVSAIGRIGDCYAQNARDRIGYGAALAAGRLPVVKGMVLSEEDLLRQDVIQAIMCYDEVDMRAIEHRHGIDFRSHFAPELARLAQLAEDGLATLGSRYIQVTPRGRLLMRVVAMCFDAYLRREHAPPQRFSRVI
jgi:oxygen-independent coproporphyrinogen III oxidase